MIIIRIWFLENNESDLVSSALVAVVTKLQLRLLSLRYDSWAVPTSCGGGLHSFVRRGAEGGGASGRGGCTGVVLLPQERAVQTAWRSPRHKKNQDEDRRQTGHGHEATEEDRDRDRKELKRSATVRPGK